VRVECCNLVALRKGRIVEHRLEEIIEPTAYRIDALTGMDQLGCPGTNGMHTEYTAVVAVDVQFKKAGIVAEDISSGDFAEPRNPGLIGNFLFRQFVFGGTNHRYFGHRIHADGEMLRHRFRVHTEGGAGGKTALFGRRSGEAWITDHVAGDKDMRLLRPEVFVHDQAAAFVGFEAGDFEIQFVGGPHAAGTYQR